MNKTLRGFSGQRRPVAAGGRNLAFPRAMRLTLRFCPQGIPANLFVGLMGLLLWAVIPSALQPQVASASPAPVTQRGPLAFCRGEQRLLVFPGLIRYSLGAPVVSAHSLPSRSGADAKTRADSVLLRAVQAGYGDLWVWKTDGKVEKRSIHVRLCRTAITAPLESAVSALEEAEVHVNGQGGVLRGVIESRTELARIRAIVASFPQKVKDETRPSETLLQAEHKEVNDWISEKSGSYTLQSELLGNSIRIKGNVENAGVRRALEEEISSRFLLARPELSSLPDLSPTIYFRVFLLELKKDRFGAIGLSWPGSSPGAFRVTTAGIPRFEDLLQLDLTLEALEGDGSLKVLSRPEMAVRAPGEAELFAGGELPIQSHGRYFSNVAWKPYGLTLKLKVTHSTETQVRLDIFTEVSQLDGGVAADSIPGIRANRMKTQVDARFGSPLLLSGLLQERDRESARGLPALRRIPILGSLFGSADYLQDKSELVAILLPLRTPPQAPSVPKKENSLMQNEQERFRATAYSSAQEAKSPDLRDSRAPRRVERVFPLRDGRAHVLRGRFSNASARQPQRSLR